MVKSKKIWFRKPLERKTIIDPLNVAILSLRGAQFGDESKGIGQKVAAALISVKDYYVLDLVRDYVCGCCRLRKNLCPRGIAKFERLRSKVNRAIAKNSVIDKRAYNGRKSWVTTTANRKKVMTFLTSGPKKSIRKAARRTGISRSSAHRLRISSVDKNGVLCSWQAVERCQFISEDNKLLRVRYCISELKRMFGTVKLPDPTNPDWWVPALVRAVGDESGKIALIPNPNIHNSGTYGARKKTPPE